MALEIKVAKRACWLPFNLDADGAPLAAGERMVEIEPGLWAHPDMAAILKLIQEAAGGV